MLEKNILRLVSILILCAGIYVCVEPASVAERLKSFYSTYPIIRYAGAKQLTSRTHFVRLIGIVLIIVGILCFLSL